MTLTDLKLDPLGRTPQPSERRVSQQEAGGGCHLAPAQGRSTLHRLWVRLRTSPWLPLVLRASGGALAIALLAAIGASSIDDGSSGVSFASALPLGASSSPEWLASGDRGPLASPRPGAAPPKEPESVPSAGATVSARSEEGSDAGACRSEPCRPPAEAGAISGITADGKVILNVATAEELTRLPGVGPKRAAAIVRLRSRLKRFRRATELLRVRGIGPKTLRKMLPHLTLDPEAQNSSRDAGS